jgi:hypothetical protein
MSAADCPHEQLRTGVVPFDEGRDSRLQGDDAAMNAARAMPREF